MIIGAHVWLSEPNSWGDLTMMDDAMLDAGGGFLQPSEAGVRFLKYAKHFKVLNKCLWGTDNYDCREDVPYIKSFPRVAKELNIAPGLPDLTDDDIAAYLGGNAARLLQLDGSDKDQQN